MTDKNVTQLPDRSITLDLDTAERPQKDIKPDFVVNVEGRKIKIEDPETLDWRDLLTIERPLDLVRVAMSSEDRSYLLGLNLPGWKLNRLFDAYDVHYGLSDKMAEAQRRARLG